MKVGILLTTQRVGPSVDVSRAYHEALAEAVAADEAGFSCCLVPEHHLLDDGYVPSPFVLLGAVAAETHHVEVGTCVVPLPLYHPLQVAESALVLDQLSRGRLVLGLGLGWSPAEFDRFGVPLADAVDRMEVGLHAVVRELRGGSASIQPRPFDLRHPPVLVGATAPRARRRAVAISDGWIADNLWHRDGLQQAADRAREEARAAGQAGMVMVLRDFHLSEGPDDAATWWSSVTADLDAYRRAGYFAGSRFRADPGVTGIDGSLGSDFARDRCLVGSAADLRRELARYSEEAGCDYVLLILRHPAGPSHREVMAQIEMIGSEVIARL